MATNEQLIREIVAQTNPYLDHLERANRLWNELNDHLRASHLAESLGDIELVPLHLQAVMRLMAEIYSQ